MSNLQYMRIHLKDIINNVVVEYSLLPIADVSGYVYVNTRKGMYVLKEAIIIANKRFSHNLQSHGYAPVEHTPSLWTHSTLPTTFTLAVDDFGINFFTTDYTNYPLDAIQNNYSITVDPSGSKYCIFTINWNYPDN